MDSVTNLNTTWKSALALFWFVFNAAVVALTTRYGDPHNSLHASAQAWSYVSAAATLGALGFPFVLDALKPKA